MTTTDGRELAIDAVYRSSVEAPFVVDEPAAPYVRDLSFSDGSGWKPAAPSGSGWLFPCPHGCRARYRFLLREAALALGDPDEAIASGDVFVAPPAAWLLRPEPSAVSGRFVFHVHTGAAIRFLSGVQGGSAEPSSPGSERFEAATGEIDETGFSAFGPLRVHSFAEAGARVDVAIAPHDLELGDQKVLEWIRTSVRAVASIFGEPLPSRRTLVIVMRGGRGETRGKTLSGGGPAVLLRVGGDPPARALANDWVATHELIHVHFPSLGREHAWMTEGLATYLEPIGRARIGQLDPAQLWHDMIEGLPQGLPEPGDQGLEKTRTWGRTYWGGALFWFLADLKIREATSNRKSVDDVVRAIAKTGATAESRWEVSRVLDIGDQATGTRVLHELYDRLAREPGSVDLSGLFAELGVRDGRDGVEWNDAAPWSSIRKAITSKVDSARDSR